MANMVLNPIFYEVKTLLVVFDSSSFVHVYKELNVEAYSLLKEGLQLTIVESARKKSKMVLSFKEHSISILN